MVVIKIEVIEMDIYVKEPKIDKNNETTFSGIFEETYCAFESAAKKEAIGSAFSELLDARLSKISLNKRRYTEYESLRHALYTVCSKKLFDNPQRGGKLHLNVDQDCSGNIELGVGVDKVKFSAPNEFGEGVLDYKLYPEPAILRGSELIGFLEKIGIELTDGIDDNSRNLHCSYRIK